VDGSGSLRRALELSARDFDALSSLGGVLKRNGDYAGALNVYNEATRISNGHPYPLLNVIKLEAVIAGVWQPSAVRLGQIRRVEKALQVQATRQPPYNAPWSCFDYAETQLYLGRPDAFLELLDRGIEFSTVAWMPKTAADTLRLLVDRGIDMPGLREGIEKLDAAAAMLAGAGT
jgi:tetratricopeptide (TPR) repeat protein